MRFGYARVSTDDQWTRLQDDALKLQNCDRIFRDVISGSKFLRKEFSLMLDMLRPGDQVIVWRLDRLSRSLKDLIDIVAMFDEKQVELISINEQIDTRTANGRLLFHFYGMLAQFERDLIRERVLAGLKSARDRGIIGGRPTILQRENPPDVAKAYKLYMNRDQNGLTVAEIMGVTGFDNRDTFYRYMRKGA